MRPITDGLGTLTTRLSTLRNPAYTGHNRCIPCTIVNALVAVSVAVATGILVAHAAGAPLVGGVAGTLALVGGIAAIAIRGYLVPGTPALTKRYFPDRVLAWFDKGPQGGALAARHRSAADRDTDDAVDVEAVLRSAGAIEPRPDGTDLQLTADFAAAWRDEIEQVRQRDTAASALPELFGLPPDRLVEHHHGAGVSVTVDGSYRQELGQWPSPGALHADVAGAQLLERRTADWNRLLPHERSAVLAGLRIFLERCPACDAGVEFEEEKVESCCRSYDAVAVSCSECGERLFEQPLATA
jgi:hypothetical protein